MIINLRGTNGSGKSTIAKAILERPDSYMSPVVLGAYETPKGKTRVVDGYKSVLNFGEHLIIVVGPYRTNCGGCDAIKTQDLVCDAVRRAVSIGQNVLFEGVIVSTLYDRYRKLSQELRALGHGYIWAYLDTPLELCLQRIQLRNGGKPIKTSLVENKVKAIRSTRHKAESAGEDVRTIHHDKAVEEVMSWLK